MSADPTSPIAPARGIGPALALLLAAGCAAPRPQPGTAAPIAVDAVTVEYGFALALRETVALDDADWRRVAGAFEPPAATPAEERGQVRCAIAILEQIAGARTPTGADLGGNRTPPGSIGQMDCVNEAANTTTYLRLLAQHGLLRHHEVLDPTLRAPRLVDAHHAAQIRERERGTRYVVDSWPLDNGRPPFIQTHERWRRNLPYPPQGGGLGYLDLTRDGAVSAAEP